MLHPNRRKLFVQTSLVVFVGFTLLGLLINEQLGLLINEQVAWWVVPLIAAVITGIWMLNPMWWLPRDPFGPDKWWQQ